METIARGDRVALRDREARDFEIFLRWRSQGEWRDYDAPWEIVPAPTTAEEIEEYRRRFLESCAEPVVMPRKRAVIEAADGVPLGWVNRYAIDRFPNACFVGIDICEDAHLNKGLGTEAMRLWVEHLFTNSDLHRIGIDTWSFNPRMMRVALKLGFSFEGAQREIREWRGEWHSLHHYGLLRKEWEASRGKLL